MSSLDKYKLEYEYDMTYPEIRKALKARLKIKPHDRIKIKRLRKQGFTCGELALMYDVTPQKIAAITRGRYAGRH